MQFAKDIEASGVVDRFWCIDVLSSWFPRHIWNESITPLAAVGDFDSIYDAYGACCMAAAATETLGTMLSTNALRYGPAEMMHRAITLADASERGTLFCVGTGEAYNTVPWGYKRSLGLARLEDHLRLYPLLWECDGPIDFEGRTVKFDQAYLGTVRGRRPEFMALGAGPKFLKLAGKYADGVMTAPINCPGAVTPERYEVMVKEVKQDVEKNGRDPDAYRLGLTPAILCHDDPEVIDRVLRSPIIKLFSCVFGRTEQADWAAEGVKSPWPDNWNYSLHYLPTKWSKDELDAALARTPEAAVPKGWVVGSPKEVAATLQGFIDAGCDCVGIYDFLLAGISDPDELAEDMPKSFERQLEISRLIKEANPPAS